MNNQELMEFFQTVNNNNNCFDCVVALKKIKKQYHKSEFFKQTHMPLKQAYKIFQYNGILKLCQFLNSPMIQTVLSGDSLLLRLYVQNFLADFDTSALEPIFNFIENKINNFDLVDNADLMDLKNIVTSFLSSIGK